MGENVKILDSIHEPDQYDIDDSMILPPLSPEPAAASAGNGASRFDRLIYDVKL